MNSRHERSRDGRSLLPALLGTGIVAALATTGGVLTVVGWTGESTSETFTVHAAGIPRADRPAARAAVRPRISWKPVRISGDVQVERYVVTRHLGEVTQVACDIPASARPRCTDRYAPAGYRASYTVTARHGAYWAGPDSAPSPEITVPGVAVPIAVDGVLIVPGTDGVPVVAGGAPAGASPTPSSPAGEPTPAPARPDAPAGEQPVRTVPPASPESGTTEPGAPAGEVPDEAAPEPSSEPVTESATTPDGAAAEVPAATGD